MAAVDTKNIAELKKEFKQYLNDNHSNLAHPEIIVCDAMYWTSHDIGVTLDDALSNGGVAKLKEALKAHFTKIGRKNPTGQAHNYLRNFRLLKEYVTGTKDELIPFDEDELNKAIESYIAYLPDHFSDEVYKWEAIKCFQDNWNAQTENFSQMFYTATAETSNLLTSGYSFPRQMIKQYAEVEGETVRQMFNDLFDEGKELPVRIDAFISSCDGLQKRHPELGNIHFNVTDTADIYSWSKHDEHSYFVK